MASTPPSASKQRKPTGIGKIAGVIFVASAGAGAAHLTVSEIFPMDTRAMAIAFLYATGTIVGGFGGPALEQVVRDPRDREDEDQVVEQLSEVTRSGLLASRARWNRVIGAKRRRRGAPAGGATAGNRRARG